MLLWAIVPTLLYYLGIFLAVEIDARRFGAQRGRASRSAARGSCCCAPATTSFASASSSFFLAIDVPPFRAVVYATLIAALFGLVEAVLARQTVVTGFDDDDAESEKLAERCSSTTRPACTARWPAASARSCR